MNLRPRAVPAREHRQQDRRQQPGPGRTPPSAGIAETARAISHDAAGQARDQGRPAAALTKPITPPATSKRA